MALVDLDNISDDLRCDLDRFLPIINKLKIFKKKDLDILVKDDFLSLTQEGTPERLLMKIFCETFLFPKRAELNLDWNEKEIKKDNATLSSFLNKEVLNLSGIIGDDILSEHILKTVSWFGSELINNPEQASTITTINLSGCRLHDIGATFLVSVLLKYVPNLKVLNLSDTFYTPEAWKALKELLPKLDKLIIFNTQLINKTFFNSISEQDLLKIIWVPGRWMFTNSWMKSVPINLCKQVEEIHKNYHSVPSGKK